MKYRSFILSLSLLGIDGAGVGTNIYTHKENSVAPEPAEEVERRRQSILSNSFPWPTLDSEPGGIAFCFQSGGGLQNPTQWQRWLEEAYDWIHRTGLEHKSVAPEDSKILRTYTHYSVVIDRQAVLDVMPPIMKNGLVSDPVACRWGPTNPCTYRVLEYAYDHCPSCGYFWLVSDNTVPLKRFQEIYEAYRKDQRIRARITFPVYMWAYGAFVPKASLWKGMPRQIVSVLVQNKEEWTPGIWLRSDYHPRTLAAPDEWHAFLPLVRRYGDALFDMIDDGSSYTGDPQFDRTVWIKDCWSFEACPKSDWSGDHFPLTIEAFDDGFIDEMYADPNLWFFRKASDRTTVKVSGKKVPLYDYMTDKLLKFKTDTLVNTTSLWLPDSRLLENWAEFIDEAASHNPPLTYLVPNVTSLKNLLADDTRDRQY